MAKIQLSDAVRVDLRINGADLSGEYGPGEVSVPDPVAELLIAQGVASAVTPVKSSKSKPETSKE